MADDRIDVSESESRTYWAWTEIFRVFQVALDPKKLILAAAGILVTYAGWWLLAVIFASGRTEPKQSDYDTARYQKEYNLSEEDAKKRAELEYAWDLQQYKQFYRLAGKGIPESPDEWKQHSGLLRVAPWHEDRGPNPFQMVSGQLRGQHQWRGGRSFVDWFFTQQVPILLEPLDKFLRPVVQLLHPHASGWNRLYLILVTLWTVATWAFFGGAITRLAAVQIARKDRPGLMETLRFVASRYLSYFTSPLVPFIFICLLVLLFVLYGLVIHIWPFIGDIADGVAFPVLVLLGFGQAILLIGLIGYPLMFATISCEGSDTFDALSRSYQYVFSSPWNYLWYSFVAIVYGAALIFFVSFMGSLVVYLTKWSLSQTPFTQYFATRRIDNLFLEAPTSYHWRSLLVTNPGEISWYGQISTVIVSLWVTLFFLLVIGFGYSYFFSAFTMVYLLMRRKVDDTEIDDVYLEEDEDDEPLLPPSPPPTTSSTQTSLTVVEAPATPTPPPAPAPAPTPSVVEKPASTPPTTPPSSPERPAN